MTRLTLLGLDRLPYASTRSISEICIRRCEPVHICAARLVPRSSGALQRGREKCVPSFLPSRRLRPFFATGVTPIAASEYRYCLQGDDYAGAGDCGFASYQQFQAAASGRTAYCGANPYLSDNSCQAASSLTPRASRANSDL